jgi:hypothetical protein
LHYWEGGVRKSLWLVVPLLLVAAATVWWRSDLPEARTAANASQPSPASAASEPAARVMTPVSTAVAQIPAPPPTKETKPLFVGGFEASLRADADGKLVMDEETLRALEMLTRMGAGEREQRLQRLGEQLPSVATSQALDLLQRVTDYRRAALQAFPPNSVPANATEARSMLEAAHRLRIDYLGEDAAGTFFAKQEQQARRLIDSLDAPTQEQVRRNAPMLSMAYTMFIVPRKPARAIGQQDQSN